jgi:arylsulfatase A-like enzyme
LIFAGPGIRAQAVCREPAELLDIYPTLAALCGLPAPADQEGHSLLPQLQNPETPRPWPAITTHNHDNHGVRTRDWRYIRYADGSEELYNMQQDPHEWHNLAASTAHASVLAEHRRLAPPQSRQPVPGSRDRILLYDPASGRLNWEGTDIPPRAPIPELED